MGFHVGQKVVAVFSGSSLGLSIKKGSIYQIRRIIEFSDETLLTLKGQAKVFHPHYGTETGWESWAFRPLVSTNIDVFKAILANPRKELETVE